MSSCRITYKRPTESCHIVVFLNYRHNSFNDHMKFSQWISKDRNHVTRRCVLYQPYMENMSEQGKQRKRQMQKSERFWETKRQIETETSRKYREWHRQITQSQLFWYFELRLSKCLSLYHDLFRWFTLHTLYILYISDMCVCVHTWRVVKISLMNS